MNMYSLHRRLEHTNMSVYAVHPGVMDTPILGDLGQSSFYYKIGIKLYKMMGESLTCRMILILIMIISDTKINVIDDVAIDE